MGEPVVFIGIPTYDGKICADTMGAILTASDKVFPQITPENGSLLCFVFNKLLAHALNGRKAKGFTHFLLHHADIAADARWLDVMLEEMDKHNADVLSVAVPIKDTRGLLSCGYRTPGDYSTTRFTMKELHAFPETFDAEGCGHADAHLMINTGLMLLRFGTWVDKFPGFTILDGLGWADNGDRIPQILSEDWHFSQWAAEHGLRVFCTRKVRVGHHGAMIFFNDSVWGTCATDPGDGPRQEEKPESEHVETIAHEISHATADATAAA